MSATIMRIMTSSSTRKTEQPAGRVATMMDSLRFRGSRFAKNAPWCNLDMARPCVGALEAVTTCAGFPGPQRRGHGSGSRQRNQNVEEILP
jgi:hypothetical protein